MKLKEIGGKASGVIKENEGMIVIDGDEITVKQAVELLDRLPAAYLKLKDGKVVIVYRR